jgi:Flp pilus assembly protein TadG
MNSLFSLGRLGRKLRSFGKRKDGATAVELALIAGPFFFTLFALAEVALMAVVQTNLDLAMADTARRIRTGEVQTQGLSAADVKNEVCAGMSRIMAVNCGADLFIDIDRFSAFQEVSNPDPSEDGTLDPGEFGFNPGAPSDIILARGFYRWKVFTPFFQDIFGTMGNGQRLMASAILFRNEPFPNPTPGP